MKRLFLIAMIFWVGGADWAEARLGESLGQCESRYGPVIERRAARLDKSDAEACVFSKSGVSVLVEFRAGIAWNLQYRSIDLGAGQVMELLKANMSEGGGWSAVFEVAGAQYRLASDRLSTAVFRPAKRGDIGVLELSARDYAELTYVVYEQRINAVVGSSTGRAGAGGLKGF